MTDPNKFSKACEGDCEWSETDAFGAEFDALQSIDEVAYAFLIEVMEDAEKDGVGDDDLSAPEGVGRAFRAMINQPWLGALCADGREDKRGNYEQYRVYFGEAPVSERSLVASKLGAKPARSPDHIWRPKQDSHIKEAIGRLRSWCKRHRYDYRKLRKR
ncbi:hypothetical protein ACW9HK_32615 [Nocardia gipuzkoensis]